MVLTFTAIGDNAQVQDFSCDLSSLEDALDILTIIVFQGHTIIKAHIVDEGNRTELPSEVFDGEPLSASMKKLEKQWKAVLQKPIRSSVLIHNKWRQDITRQRVRIYDDRIAHFNTVISRLAQLRQRLKERDSSSQRSALIRRYDLMISVYDRYVDRIQAERQAALNKLIQLEKSC